MKRNGSTVLSKEVTDDGYLQGRSNGSIEKKKELS